MTQGTTQSLNKPMSHGASGESTSAQPEQQDPSFYLVATPGLEDLVATELKSWLPNVVAEVGKGGVSFTAPLLVGLALNRVLKTPTRILLRLADFGCRDFPKLFKKVSNFPWEDWFADDAEVEFHASTHESRLRIKKRIEETCLDGRRARLKKRGVQKAKKPDGSTLKESEPSFTVYVRFQNDICTISLDTSGEILHKRGLRAMSSEAPLRESTAASLLLMLQEGAEGESGIELVDPMMGGGTFFLEAVQLDQVIETSQRPFAFEALRVWKKDFQTPFEVPNRSGIFASYVGFESSAKTLQAACENLNSLKDSRPMSLVDQDFFSSDPLPTEKRRWLIANPPYGERLRIEGSLKSYYEKLLAEIDRIVSPERACLIFPEKAQPQRFSLPRGWKIQASRRFLNGGIPVVAVLFSHHSKTK